jgi:sulfur relay (sulfurtransferase) complex TusBCD TusD component (DsrE family)
LKTRDLKSEVNVFLIVDGVFSAKKRQHPANDFNTLEKKINEFINIG